MNAPGPGGSKSRMVACVQTPLQPRRVASCTSARRPPRRCSTPTRAPRRCAAAWRPQDRAGLQCLARLVTRRARRREPDRRIDPERQALLLALEAVLPEPALRLRRDLEIQALRVRVARTRPVGWALRVAALRVGEHGGTGSGLQVVGGARRPPIPPDCPPVPPDVNERKETDRNRKALISQGFRSILGRLRTGGN